MSTEEPGAAAGNKEPTHKHIPCLSHTTWVHPSHPIYLVTHPKFHRVLHLSPPDPLPQEGIDPEQSKTHERSRHLLPEFPLAL